MTNRVVIQRRLEKIRIYLDFLRGIARGYGRESFAREAMVHGSAERYLQLCIEALLDVGNHVISDQKLGRVEHYADIPRLLCEHGILDERQRDLMLQIVGFRNILVHDYMDLDVNKVYDVIEHSLDDLEGILRVYVERFLT